MGMEKIFFFFFCCLESWREKMKRRDHVPTRQQQQQQHQTQIDFNTIGDWKMKEENKQTNKQTKNDIYKIKSSCFFFFKLSKNLYGNGKLLLFYTCVVNWPVVRRGGCMTRMCVCQLCNNLKKKKKKPPKGTWKVSAPPVVPTFFLFLACCCCCC